MYDSQPSRCRELTLSSFLEISFSSFTFCSKNRPTLDLLFAPLKSTSASLFVNIVNIDLNQKIFLFSTWYSNKKYGLTSSAAFSGSLKVASDDPRQTSAENMKYKSCISGAGEFNLTFQGSKNLLSQSVQLLVKAQLWGCGRKCLSNQITVQAFNQCLLILHSCFVYMYSDVSCEKEIFG